MVQLFLNEILEKILVWKLEEFFFLWKAKVTCYFERENWNLAEVASESGKEEHLARFQT